MFRFFYEKKLYKFIKYLTEYANLNMIELASNKEIKDVIKSSEFNSELDKNINDILSLHSYKTWKILLSMEGSYEKLDIDIKKDILLNLKKFFINYYKMIFKKFNMKNYAIYQTHEKEDINRILFVECALVNKKRTKAVVMFYENGQRMAYNPKDGNRLIIEKIAIDEKSTIITFVSRYVSSFEKMKNFLMELLFEEE